MGTQTLNFRQHSAHDPNQHQTVALPCSMPKTAFVFEVELHRQQCPFSTHPWIIPREGLFCAVNEMGPQEKLSAIM